MGDLQRTLPLIDKPWSEKLPASRYPSLVVGVSADTMTFLALAIGLVLSTCLIYRKSSFPQDSADFWSARTVDAGISKGKKLLESNSESLADLVEYGIACYQKGPEHYVEGLKALERARYLGALDERVFWYAARMYEEKGLTHFALEDYERYMRIRPADTPTRLRVAALLYKAGDAERAFKHYQVILAESPRNTSALYNMALIYVQRGENEKARALFEQCRKILGYLPTGGHFMLGQIYEAESRSNDALGEYKKEFSKNGSNVALLKAMGSLYEAQGNPLEAGKIWKLASQLDPRDALVKAKMRKISKNTRRPSF